MSSIYAQQVIKIPAQGSDNALIAARPYDTLMQVENPRRPRLRTRRLLALLLIVLQLAQKISDLVICHPPGCQIAGHALKRHTHLKQLKRRLGGKRDDPSFDIGLARDQLNTLQTPN